MDAHYPTRRTAGYPRRCPPLPGPPLTGPPLPGPPLPGPPLLCDEMLHGMGRWLRAAGYDTAQLPSGSPDADVLALGEAEGRLLLTCDRALAARAGAARAAGRAGSLLLRGNAPDDWAVELHRRLGVDWLAAPFTRCLVDNRPLRTAAPGERAGLPASRHAAEATACPACGRLYWAGGHVRRMAAHLARWRALCEAPPEGSS